jgi:hypothetical protein
LLTWQVLLLSRPSLLIKSITNLFHLVKRNKRLIKSKLVIKSIFLISGILSLLWFIIRVIPKPQRAYYPCMRAAMPIASSFVIYLISLSGSVVFLRKAKKLFKEERFKWGILILAFASIFTVLSLVQNNAYVSATTVKHKWFSDPLGANDPIGVAKGIFPGRVVWVFDPNATNQNCTNSNKADAYFQNINTNQTVVDDMVNKGILSITGQTTQTAAWDTIFKFFNVNHGKGVIGYVNGEKIFIKINAVSAWSGSGSTGEFPSGGNIEFDTSPQSLLALLRSLINEGGIPQENIYLGDPMADIWNHVYNVLHEEFSNVKYVSQSTVTPGRYHLTKSTKPGITYSDSGKVLTHEDTEGTRYFYDEMMNADYLINVPSMKGHEMAGVTMFAKNFFGANSLDHSWSLHLGLVYDDIKLKGTREDYKMYRVLVDLMACKHLGGNTLLYFMDGLWSTSKEHQKPQKFLTYPFNNDWSSSLFFSLDPVAIESVGIDIMQNEFTQENMNTNPPKWKYANYGAVDDYLHQAASSDWWPDGIKYDPDSTGTPIGSLGVHEHWNNNLDMQYSRNLETGNGIELVKIFVSPNTVNELYSPNSFTIYPNPCQETITLHLNLSTYSSISIEIFSLNVRKVFVQQTGLLNEGKQEISLNLNNLDAGIYFCRVNTTNGSEINTDTQKIVKN